MGNEPAKWFWDRISANLVQLHSIEAVLYTGRTKYQSIEIIRTGSFGKCLVLDNKIQSSDLDEFIYHEALVQPALVAHPHPRKVFIAGGGEGATLREVLRHRSVTRAVMIDIDPDVIAICRQYLPEYAQGAFEDPRTELKHVDARQYLADSTELFDAIIIDLTEPIEEGPAYRLYTQEFYRLVNDRLTPDGVMAVQAGCASLNELLSFSAVYQTLRSVFPVVRPYQVDVPAFGGPWGFCLAARAGAALSSVEIDGRIAARGLALRFYDGRTDQGMFALARPLRDELGRQTRLITDREPLYI